MFIKARDSLAEGEVQPRSLLEELVRRAPGFAPAHASVCMQILGSARTASPADFTRLRSQAVAECKTAAKLDPEFGVSYRGLSYAIDGRQWAQREAVLRAAAANTKSPEIDASLGEFMTQAGRQNEGIRLLQAAAARQSWTIYATHLGYALLMSDRPEEAPEYIAKRLALRPNDTDMRALALLHAAYRGSPDEALAILDDPNRRPQDLPPVAIKAYRAFLTARRSGSAADRQAAIATILDTVGGHDLLQHYAVPMLVELGDLEDAFRVAQEFASDPKVLRYGTGMQPGFLFGPETRAMRADPRFIPIVRSLGLVDYWRTSGDWPDFCAQEPRSVCAEMKRQAGSR
jgi:tetratricopeptide (TPR) repeat protein